MWKSLVTRSSLRALLLLGTTLLLAPRAALGSAARIDMLSGDLELRSSAQGFWDEAEPGDELAPGSALRSGPLSRAKLTLGGGSVLWLDEGSELDLVSTEDVTLLRLWRGAAVIHAVASGLRVDAKAATLQLEAPGRYRVSVSEDDFLHASAESGRALVRGTRGAKVTLRAGHRTSVFPGADPESAYYYNTALRDELDAWVEGTGVAGGAAPEPRDAPPLERGYEARLASYGDWRYYPALEAQVWQPRVATGWRPYLDGHWVMMPAGVTWVSREPWGAVTYHYGTWDYEPGFGWFWVPGLSYAPAHVDWWLAGDYIGWCPRTSYRYVDRHGRERHHERRRSASDRARPFDSDRTLVVRRDRLFDRRVRETLVEPARLDGSLLLRRKRLVGVDFQHAPERDRSVLRQTGGDRRRDGGRATLPDAPSPRTRGVERDPSTAIETGFWNRRSERVRQDEERARDPEASSPSLPDYLRGVLRDQSREPREPRPSILNRGIPEARPAAEPTQAQPSEKAGRARRSRAEAAEATRERKAERRKSTESKPD